MKIFITGSNGFVGSRLMWFLEEKGYEVWGIDKSELCLQEKHPHTLVGDIRKIEDLRNFNDKNFDLIVHCAAEKHDFGISKESYYSNNEYGTQILIDYASERDIKKVIYYSTVAVYGHQDHPCDETAEYRPNTIYGDSKLAGEKVIGKWFEKDSTQEVVFLRPTIIYGPNNFANMYKLINTQYNRPFVMVGRGEHIKSIVSLENLVDMTYFIMERMKPGIQAFNCIDKPYITLHKLMKIIASHNGFKMPMITVPPSFAIFIGKTFDILGYVFRKDFPINSERMMKFSTATDYRSEKIRNLGYGQQHTIEEEISRTIDWFCNSKQTQVPL